MDDNKNFSRPDPENLPQTPNADNASEAADDIDDVIKIFHKDNSDIHLHKEQSFSIHASTSGTPTPTKVDFDAVKSGSAASGVRSYATSCTECTGCSDRAKQVRRADCAKPSESAEPAAARKHAARKHCREHRNAVCQTGLFRSTDAVQTSLRRQLRKANCRSCSQFRRFQPRRKRSTQRQKAKE